MVRNFNEFDSSIDFPAYKDLRGMKLTLDFCKSILRGWNSYFQTDLTNRYKRANPINTEIPEIKEISTVDSLGNLSPKGSNKKPKARILKGYNDHIY